MSLYACTKSTSADRARNATIILFRVDEGSWWVGRVQAMKQSNGHTFGVRTLFVDLLARIEEFGRRNPHNPYIEVMLQYYMKHPS